MKKILPAFIMIMAVAGCKQSAIKQSFSSTDSLVIHFKDEQAAVVTKTVQTTESNAINRMIDFIDAKETEQFNADMMEKCFFIKKEKNYRKWILK
jgi:hypothetical protein